MIPAFSSQIEEEEPAEQTENRLQGVGDQGSMVSKNPRDDGSQEVGRCVGQRLEQMCALDLATWRPGLRRVREQRGRSLSGGGESWLVAKHRGTFGVSWRNSKWTVGTVWLLIVYATAE